MPLRVGGAVYIDSTMAHASLATGPRSALVLNVRHSPDGERRRTRIDHARRMRGLVEAANAVPTA